MRNQGKDIECIISEMIHRLHDAREDALKALDGNKSAGIRIRSLMQIIKTDAQDVRAKVLELRSIGYDK